MSSTRPSDTLIIGTRGSELALAQTHQVRGLLEAAHPGLRCEIQVIKTIGDKRPDLKLTDFSKEAIVDKGIFTKELEIALGRKDIDLAVHSLKDVPTALDEDFLIAAVLPRVDTADVLISRRPLPDGIASLTNGARVATSSVRRKAQLQWRRPDLEIEEIRGNVPTRLRKLLEPGAPEAIVLAAAGLERLGLVEADGTSVKIDETSLPVAYLRPPVFLPASGQGAIGIECRRADSGTRDFLNAINDAATMTRVTAERALLDRLQAGCHTPVGVHTWFAEDGKIHMLACVFNEQALTEPPRQGTVVGDADAVVSLIDQLMHQLYA